MSEQAHENDVVSYIENVAHANQLPPTGSTITALPLKMQKVTESPIRLIAFIRK